MKVVVTLVEDYGQEFCECSRYLDPAEVAFIEGYQDIAAEVALRAWRKMKTAHLARGPLQYPVGTAVLVDGWRAGKVKSAEWVPGMGKWLYSVELDHDEGRRLPTAVIPVFGVQLRAAEGAEKGAA